MYIYISMYTDAWTNVQVLAKGEWMEPSMKEAVYRGELPVGRIWWPEATRLEDPLNTSNGTWTPKSSGERDGILNLV
jgi:hypothetical protein